MKNNGFSLVELSIVLVILGLLTGGILTGQTLIRAAELRAVTTEFQNYRSATNTFRDKYFALPGDMRNAEQFWGTLDASDATCKTASSAAVATCNGDGDGRINRTAPRSNEPFRFWQHLANAGLIEGRYAGAQGSIGSEDAEIGINVPRSKLSNAGWTAFTFGAISTSGIWFAGEPGNSFTFGTETGAVDAGIVGSPALAPEEAWNVDTKLDDGQPGTGNVQSSPTTDALNPNCSTGSTNTANYDLATTSIECRMFFVNSF